MKGRTKQPVGTWTVVKKMREMLRYGEEYRGEDLRIVVYTISGLPTTEWYVDCRAMGIDALRAPPEAKDIGEAKAWAIRLLEGRALAFLDDLTRAKEG